MTGAILNAAGILLGGLFGLVRGKPLSPAAQNRFRVALGVVTVFLGLRLVWTSLNGSGWSVSKQILIVLLSVTLGRFFGKACRLQKMSNRLGRYASRLIAAPPAGARRGNDGFVACAALFCAAPLGWLGAVTNGLSGDYYLLAVKAVMDGLALTSFVKMFGWPAMLSAVPVFLTFGSVTLACRLYAVPFLDAHGLVNSVEAAAGLVACAVALVIFELRKVELANYLPGLALAPLITWLLG